MNRMALTVDDIRAAFSDKALWDLLTSELDRHLPMTLLDDRFR
jgi:hypothetical protein